MGCQCMGIFKKICYRMRQSNHLIIVLGSYMKAKKLFQNKLIVKRSKTHGFGVFAGQEMRKGEKIEECYAIITRGGDRRLDDYYFEAKDRQFALLTGYGSIYNHSDDPNADYFINKKKCIATIIADRAIRKGEEIFVSYGDEYFTSRGWTPKGAVKKTSIKTKKKSGKKPRKKVK